MLIHFYHKNVDIYLLFFKYFIPQYVLKLLKNIPFITKLTFWIFKNSVHLFSLQCKKNNIVARFSAVSFGITCKIKLIIRAQ